MAASVATFCLGAAIFGGMILLPLYFQNVRGTDPVVTGLLLIPQGIGVAIAMGITGRLVDRMGGGVVALGGVIITSLFTLPLVFVGAHTPYIWIDATLVARGIGVGSSMMPSMAAAFAVLRPDEIHDASPQLNVIQRVGGSVGTAILAVILSHNVVEASTAAGGEPGAGRVGPRLRRHVLVGPRDHRRRCCSRRFPDGLGAPDPPPGWPWPRFVSDPEGVPVTAFGLGEG